MSYQVKCMSLEAATPFVHYISPEGRSFTAQVDKLEPYFSHWETECKKRGRTLNNPKIPVNFVRKHGELKVI